MAEKISEEDVKQALEKQFGGTVANFSAPRRGRAWADVPLEKMKEVIAFLRESLGFDHLSTITGLDAGENYEILYHLFANGMVLTLKTRTPVSDPKIPTVTHLFPGAENYERELEDMLGIKVEGLAPGRNYPLPDDWPRGNYPLRKSWKTTDAFPDAA